MLVYFLYFLEPFTLDSRCPVFPLPVLYCIPNKNSKHQTGSSSFSWKIPWKTIPYPKEQSSLFNINYNFRQFNHLCGNCIMKTLTSSFDPQQFVSISYQQILAAPDNTVWKLVHSAGTVKFTLCILQIISGFMCLCMWKYLPEKYVWKQNADNNFI